MEVDKVEDNMVTKGINNFLQAEKAHEIYLEIGTEIHRQIAEAGLECTPVHSDCLIVKIEDADRIQVIIDKVLSKHGLKEVVV